MNDYKILSRFEYCGKNMVTVRFNNSAHVMTVEDLRMIQRCLFKAKNKRFKMETVA